MTLSRKLAFVAVVLHFVTSSEAHRFLRSHHEAEYDRPFPVTTLMKHAHMLVQEFASMWEQELATPDSRLILSRQQNDVCTIVEAFTWNHHNRVCNCTANEQTDKYFDFTWSCESTKRECTENIFGDTTCTNFTYSIEYDNLLKLSKVNYCSMNKTINDKPVADTCFHLEYCNDTIFNTVCGCSITIADVDCLCSLCYNGFGVYWECPDDVSTECVKFDPNFDKQDDGADVFDPNSRAEPRVTSWCQLVNDFFESSNGQISCQCTEKPDDTESAFVSCHSNGTVCILPETDWELCAAAETNITIEDGKVTTLVVCSNVDAPVDFEELCIEVEICSYGDLSASTSLVCGVNVTYGGNPCNLVTCGSGVNTTFTVKCTDSVVIDKCIDASDVTSLTSFVPEYSKEAAMTSTTMSRQGNGSAAATTLLYGGSTASIISVLVAAVLVDI